MIRFAIFMLVIVGGLSGCASGDESLGSDPNQDRGTQTITSTLFQGRDVEMSRHALVQVSEIRRLLDTALGGEDLLRRFQMSDQDYLVYGCAKLRKIEAPEVTDMPTHAEYFKLSYRGNLCVDATETIVGGEKEGEEFFHVTYPKPVWREGSGGTIGYPTHFTMTSDALKLSMRAKDHADNTLNVSRSFSLRAYLVGQDDKTLTYRGSFQARNHFLSNWDKRWSQGELSFGIDEFRVRVDKQSRAVLAVDVVQATLKVDGLGWAKSQYTNFELSDQVHFSADVELLFAPNGGDGGGLSLSQNQCELPSGVVGLQHRSDADAGVVVQSQGGTLIVGELNSNLEPSAEENTVIPVTLCNAEGLWAFADEYSSLLR